MTEVNLKLYLKAGAQSLQVARYVKNNIKKLNKIGARFNITLLDEGETHKSYAELRKRKVENLPALLTSKHEFVGFSQIRGYLEKNMNSAETVGRAARISGDVYEDYISREMFKGDDEQKDDAGDEFHRRMNDLQSRRGETSPAPRQAPKQAPAPRSRQPARREQEEEELEDNIPPPATTQRGPRSEDDMDREMLAALIGGNDPRDSF